MRISHLRTRYDQGSLDEYKVGLEPFTLLEQWLYEAVKSKVKEPTAMVLSTIDENGKPASRVVLLKGIEAGRPVFFTNYLSNKGKQITQNQNVALLFFWPELERQLRIIGQASKLSGLESDAYFDSRPFESRVGAVVSPQSQVIDSRKYLEQKFEEMIKKSTSEAVDRPGHWGGYEVFINEVEFWQGRPGRLHDRIRFRLENDKWIRERLAP
ncbi:MAG: pyridoxamine 5'-phosphate oxidase [Lentimicrobium sp.]|nr:pyridoxamine 5'-phosphate oxidase [Lentimicrobium sp.]